MRTRLFAVVIEQGASNYSAYSPDLPGCVATGDTLEETKRMIAEAMELHLSSMLEDGDPIPEPATVDAYVLPIQIGVSEPR